MKMKNSPEKSDERRAFLKGGLRTLLLGGIACVSGLLGWREIRSAEDDGLCVLVSPCGNCPEQTDCNDPRAVESKQGITSKQQVE